MTKVQKNDCKRYNPELCTYFKSAANMVYKADKIQQLRDRLGGIGQYLENISEGWSFLMIEELNTVFDTFPAKAIERLERSIGHLREEKKVSFVRPFWGRVMCFSSVAHSIGFATL